MVQDRVRDGLGGRYGGAWPGVMDYTPDFGRISRTLDIMTVLFGGE